jgi:hypothetical protein
MGMLRVTAPRVTARAAARANALVPAGCIGRFRNVTRTYRVNLDRGFSGPRSAGNLTRAFGENLDLAALSRMTVAKRSFTLKMGPSRGEDDCRRRDDAKHQRPIR